MSKDRNTLLTLLLEIVRTVYGSWDILLKSPEAALFTGVRSMGGPKELESFRSMTWNMEALITRGCYCVAAAVELLIG